jgi:hypothetical protein
MNLFPIIREKLGEKSGRNRRILLYLVKKCDRMT